MAKTFSPDKVLGMDWPNFNRALSKLSEEQLSELLKIEVASANRSSYIERAHSRLNRLRYEREKLEIAKKAV